MKRKRLRVGVIFGGRSYEHEVSLVSATSVMKALDKSKYQVIPIGITKDGKWMVGKALKALKTKNFKNTKTALFSPDPTQKGVLKIETKKSKKVSKRLDLIFPVLHGPYGEDGTIQGLLEMANVPYVGTGVLGSALCMNKVIQKQLFKAAGITTPHFIYFKTIEWRRQNKVIKQRIKKEMGYPCFVKPANAGSSIGISKVHSLRQLNKAVRLALQYDNQIIIEKSIENAYEIEISVLGNEKPRLSVPGEIIPSGEFYDYDAKYVDNQSQAVIPAKLPKRVIKNIQKIARRAFTITNCSGMARIDFLVSKKSYQIYINEINTTPGFTSISMYPKLWEASGIPYSKLLDKLIELALERHQQKNCLKTAYQPKRGWYL